MSNPINPGRLAQIAEWGRVLRDTIDPTDYSGPEEHVASAIANAGLAIGDLLTERAAFLVRIEALEARPVAACVECEREAFDVCAGCGDSICADCMGAGKCSYCRAKSKPTT